MPHKRREVSRVEGFSDAVFAFAITLLVVSLEVPKTFHELIATVRGFPAFAVCFALLFQVWWRHYRFFRSYDLEDAYVIVWTGVLLFVVLFYVYPLKFVWSLPFAELQGRRITDEVINVRQVPTLFAIYGAGVICVFSILALLYLHAYRLRDRLGLTAIEALDARLQVYSNLSIAGWGVVSITLAFTMAAVNQRFLGLAGMIYSGIGITEWRLGEYRNRAVKRLNTTDTSPV
jgi:uncharacterized membrane protein